ncbi:MAG: hypothetical protein ACERKV_00945 [Clostridiaceae bacterium]
MNSRYLPIIMVVLSSLCYHISQKSIPTGINPIVSLIVTYFVATVISIIFFVAFVPETSLIESVKTTNWASILLGFAIVGLEMGYLLSYRVGWNISVASLLSNTLVALLLIPIGYYFFKDSISISSISGVVLCIAGLILISKG